MSSVTHEYPRFRLARLSVSEYVAQCEPVLAGLPAGTMLITPPMLEYYRFFAKARGASQSVLDALTRLIGLRYPKVIRPPAEGEIREFYTHVNLPSELRVVGVAVTADDFNRVTYHVLVESPELREVRVAREDVPQLDWTTRRHKWEGGQPMPTSILEAINDGRLALEDA